MSLLSYQLQIKKYLRELGLSDRDFNKLDVKHSDVNLIKQLKLLNPVASGPPPPAKTGWYGDFIILNSAGSTRDITMTIEADTNGTIVELNATETIQPDNFIIVSVSQQNRLTNPSTLIKVSYQVDEGGIITNNFFTGLTLTNSSSSIYNLTVDSGFINGQNIDWEFITAAPPNPTASITTTNANITPGQSTTLTPVFSNATTVTIDGSTTTPSGGAIINNTAFSVSPNVSKTYILVATNSIGVQATASVTINVASNTHWSGLITFNRTFGSGTQFITIRTEAGTLANQAEYTGNNSYFVTLQNPQSWLEVAFDYQGSWEVSTINFPNVGQPYIVYYENWLNWYRYIIPSGLGNLTFNFTSYNND